MALPILHLPFFRKKSLPLYQISECQPILNIPVFLHEDPSRHGNVRADFSCASPAEKPVFQESTVDSEVSGLTVLENLTN
jgi:hypothetical protein